MKLINRTALAFGIFASIQGSCMVGYVFNNSTSFKFILFATFVLAVGSNLIAYAFEEEESENKK